MRAYRGAVAAMTAKTTGQKTPQGTHPLLALQRAAGNRAVTDLVLQRDGVLDAAGVGRELVRAGNSALREERLLTGAAAMSEAEAFELLGNVIEATPNKLATAVMRMREANRFALLRTLVGKQGHDNAHIIRDALLGGSQLRFAALVPDAARRGSVLAVLGRPLAGHRPQPDGSLWVNLSFRAEGSISGQNQAPGRDLAQFGGGRLGLVPGRGNNGMEIRGDVVGDHGDTTFDFKRWVTMRLYYRVGGEWTLKRSLDHTDDDSNDSDEHLTPTGDGHIYSIDAPGPVYPDRSSRATHVLYVATFGEWVLATNTLAEQQWNVSDQLEWHSISKLAKRADGGWGRDPEFGGQIATGANPGMDL
ncbi:hypothetical protein AB0I28_29255 [Phytomonospora sp. NPDC050363]|uniref:hypothetical protein n=1 Tax=Phytomonospora sp. NPDC050363 TaxID=3155642 RepID=UPI0033F04ED5